MKVSLMWVKLPIDQFKRLYENWDIRTVILLSLGMQVYLILSGPFRKRTSSFSVLIPMWLAYLLADATANFAIGHMSSRGTGPPPEIMAFWAPFLLVHLGGPDTITAFALEDNELWLRHLLQLLFQFATACYVFFHSFPGNKLWLPVILMFIAGLIKYIERTVSLFLASSNKLRDSLLKPGDAGPSYAKLVEYFFSKEKANLPTRPQVISIPRRPYKQGVSPLEDWELVVHAHRYSESFKGILSDLVLNFPERDESRNFFFNRTARDAFKLAEVELSFYYEALYTKARVVHSSVGIYTRSFSFILTLAALVIFIFSGKKRFQRYDIGITYTLLYGAIALDLIALIMSLFSDWIVVTITKPEVPTEINRVLREVLNIERKRWPDQESKAKKHHCTFSYGWFRQILRRRWCETISQYNLINYCLHPRKESMETLYSNLGVAAILDTRKYVTKQQFNDDLRDLIFSELKTKAEMADDLEIARDLFSARGDWVLRLEDCTELLPWVSDVDFDESLLLWHVATEICLNCNLTEICGNRNGKDVEIDLTEICQYSRGEDGEIDLYRKREEDKKYRGISKLLSDYMLYLLILNSSIMSPVAGIAQIRFRDTCADAKKFFREKKILQAEKTGTNGRWPVVGNWFRCGKRGKNEENKKSSNGGKHEENKKASIGGGEREKLQKRACLSILAVKTDFKPITIKGDSSKSVLFDACRLAKKLEEVGKRKDKWEIMSKVWVEMLFFSAGKCRANTHAAQLGRGGQLITLVWLLMAHFGIGKQFLISDFHPRTTLTVEK